MNSIISQYDNLAVRSPNPNRGVACTSTDTDSGQAPLGDTSAAAEDETESVRSFASDEEVCADAAVDCSDAVAGDEVKDPESSPNLNTVDAEATTATATPAPPTLTLPSWLQNIRLGNHRDILPPRIQSDQPTGISQETHATDAFPISEKVYRMLEKHLITRCATKDCSVDDGWWHKFDGPDSELEHVLFATPAAVLRYPGDSRGDGFMTSVVSQFAEDVGGVIVLPLGLRDIKNLALHYARIDEGQQELDQEACFDRYFKRAEDSTRQKFPFHTVLNKYDGGLGGLIVCIRWLEDFLEDERWVNMLKDLAEATATRSDTTLLVLDRNSDVKDPWTSKRIDGTSMSDEKILSILGDNALKRVLTVTPSKTAVGHQMFEDWRWISRANDREEEIKMTIGEIWRKGSKTDNLHELLRPRAHWKFGDDSKAANWLRRDDISDEDLKGLAQELMFLKTVDLPAIEAVFEDAENQIVTLEEWRVEQARFDGQDKDAKQNHEIPWKHLPEHKRIIVEKILADGRGTTWERKLIEYGIIVDPKKLKDSWADIHLPPSTQKAITQIVSLATSPSTSGYGILQRDRLRGALLYGPPGTGKTQVARVLAHEAKATMLHVSNADIDSSDRGDTEKKIRGLFRLAKKLAPSIIFIDEADALFAQRHEGNSSATRGRLNQLVLEADGLGKTADSPFLLLATNYPQQLDHAVLRRVPALMHIGLPDREGRKAMLQMFLRGEKLAKDVDMGELAAKTVKWSGSDIKALCIQAAMICEDMMPGGSSSADSPRVMTREHFQAAFARCGPTVGSGTLNDMKKFAKEFDPAAVAKMQAVRDEQGHVLAKEPEVKEGGASMVRAQLPAGVSAFGIPTTNELLGSS